MSVYPYFLDSENLLFFIGKMQKIAAIILENDFGKFLLALRDNNPMISFPNCWDLIGGHIEEGETPEQALIREYKEELGLTLKEHKFFKKYVCLNGDVYENIKYIFCGKINIPIEEITFYEGQQAKYFKREKIHNLKFANIIKNILIDYISS